MNTGSVRPRMNRAFLFLVAVLIGGVVAGCAAPSASRSATLDLHDRLQQSSLSSSFPEEYRSFSATVATAETLSERGETLRAEHVYQLALLKGRLLESRIDEPSLNGAADAPRQNAAQAGIPPDDVPSQPQPGGQPPPQEERPEPLPEPATSVPPAIPPEATLFRETPPLPEVPGDELPLADMKRFVGTRGHYTVRKGESLKRVGARLGVDWRRLAQINDLDPREPLRPGQVIVYDNRKIVPSALRNGIVVNIADRTLYLLKNGEVRSVYPVAVGKPPRPKEEEDWSTPTGRFIITAKAKDPVWKVPQSIQDEMEQLGKEPVKEVPPGKDNPLGKYAMKTSLSGIVIHSTNAPSSVYSYASHGCIRVMPEHMERLFPAVEPRTGGAIVYQPVKLAIDSQGRIFLEVNRDVYNRFNGDLEGEVRRLITQRKVAAKVDWRRVAALLRKKSGIPEEISLNPVEASRPKPGSTGSLAPLVRSGRTVATLP